MTQSFRDLIVWQRALQLTVAIYKLTAAFPREELYGLTVQIRRAASPFHAISQRAKGEALLASSGNFWESRVAQISSCRLSWRLHVR